jgi:hypothetical protein
MARMATLRRMWTSSFTTAATLAIAFGGCTKGTGSSSATGGGTTSAASSGATGGGAASAASSGATGGGATSSASSGGAAGAGGSAPVGTEQVCPAVSPGDNETYDLPPTTPLPAGISAMTDWTQNPHTGGFAGRQVMDACRYQADPHGFATWHGKLAARVEVDPGDDPLALGEDSERAEELTLQDATGAAVPEGTGTAYYATSYYFPTSWDGTFLEGDSNSWSFVLQFYPLGGLSAGRHGPGGAQTYGFASFTFSDGGAIALGKWTDFVLMIDWSLGHVVTWRRDQGQTAFTKVVDGTDAGFVDGTSAYVKQGLYRGGDVNGRTDVLWIGPTSRGSSFMAVENASFGTNVGQPP